MMTRRETLKGVAVFAATEKLADGGLAPVSLPGVPDQPRPLPPGAGDARRFNSLCVGCGLCAKKCPGECLVPAGSLLALGRPAMDFRYGSCLLGCSVCADVCPTGAIRPIRRVARAFVQIGVAEWKKDLCLRATGEEPNCTACVRKCSVRAIHLDGGVPVVDAHACIGCGACEHVCPARPQPAIQVKGFDMQRAIQPIGDADLLSEMKALVDAGKALVVAHEGVIVRQLEGRGLDPLVHLYETEPEILRGATVWDKIVGRAAAAYYAQGGAARVFAHVMSDAARDLLRERGIVATAETRVPTIVNRAGTGECPMERAVRKLSNPSDMINAIGKELQKK